MFASKDLELSDSQFCTTPFLFSLGHHLLSRPGLDLKTCVWTGNGNVCRLGMSSPGKAGVGNRKICNQFFITAKLLPPSYLVSHLGFALCPVRGFWALRVP